MARYPVPAQETRRELAVSNSCFIATCIFTVRKSFYARDQD
jgi:hypothetical protein